MTTINHNIDLSALSRTQLQQLSADVAHELEGREHDERITLEEKLRTLVEDAGFDPQDLRFARTTKQRKPRKTSHPKGEKND